VPNRQYTEAKLYLQEDSTEPTMQRQTGIRDTIRVSSTYMILLIF